MENLEQNQPILNQGIETSDDNKKPTDFKISWATVTVSALISLILSLTTIALYTKMIAPKVYTIKIDEILTDHIKAIGGGNLTDAEKQKIATDWSAAFDESIKDLYANKNVVLTQQAVVLGGTDYTAQLKKEIALKMDAKAVQK